MTAVAAVTAVTAVTAVPAVTAPLAATSTGPGARACATPAPHSPSRTAGDPLLRRDPRSRLRTKMSKGQRPHCRAKGAAPLRRQDHDLAAVGSREIINLSDCHTMSPRPDPDSMARARSPQWRRRGAGSGSDEAGADLGGVALRSGRWPIPAGPEGRPRTSGKAMRRVRAVAWIGAGRRADPRPASDAGHARVDRAAQPKPPIGSRDGGT